ncbi:outer membrane channel protein [Roseimaritima multifibrata]|uniref:Outer membrane channel protein n=1 Tax=Roseimaritima multifibrata TaxID=1930274 RepID=A0A517MAV1_9BACT|nr:TolC family protein [Roseimaritima multifibrata]QDS92005.1 outer membrane channel protein [Roseimaritima multifibrata]
MSSKRIWSARRNQLLLATCAAATCLLFGCAQSNSPRQVTAPSQVPEEVMLAAKPASSAANSPIQTVLYSDPEDLDSAVAIDLQRSSVVEEATRLEEALVPGNVASVESAEASQPAIGVEEFVQRAIAAHPELIAARHRISAERARIPQARALPDPQFNNTFWPIQDQALQTAGGRVGNQMSLTQGVPWHKKRETKAAIAARQAHIAEAEYERMERAIVAGTKQAYYEVWYAVQAIQVLEETQGLVEDLREIADASYRTGGRQQDALRARIEADRLEDQQLRLRQQLETAQADLATFIQSPASEIPPVTAELHLEDLSGHLDEWILAAENCNPELKGLAWEVERDRQAERLACLQKYPDLQFGVNWSLISDDYNVLSPVADGHDNINFSVGTTLPIWRSKIQAGIREANHRRASTSQRLEAKRDSLEGRLRSLLSQVHRIEDQRQLYRQRIIPRTEETLQLVIADYQGSRTDFSSVIEVYRELLVFETQLAEFDASLAKTFAQLEQTAGCPLP